jgi:hypothetical protein
MGAGKPLEPNASLAQRQGGQGLAVRSGQEVEHDQQRRSVAGEPRDTAGRRVDSLEQRVEGKRAVHRHHDLAVEDEALGFELRDRFDDLGKVAGERLAGFRLQLDLFAIAKDQAAEAVPFRLVLPFGTGRHRIDGKGFHRRERGTQREAHRTGTRISHDSHNANGRPFGQPLEQ